MAADPPVGTFSIILAAGWFDEDLLELAVTAEYGVWRGTERAYAGHAELAEFAQALGRVGEAASANADLVSGPAEVGQLELRVSEYGRARHLAVDLLLARVEERHHLVRVHGGLHITAPTEHGLVADFALQLATLAARRAGTAYLGLKADW